MKASIRDRRGSTLAAATGIMLYMWIEGPENATSSTIAENGKTLLGLDLVETPLAVLAVAGGPVY